MVVFSICRSDQSRRRQLNNNLRGRIAKNRRVLSDNLEGTVEPVEYSDALLETILCTEDGVEWSEVVSSSATVYESNVTPNKNSKVCFKQQYFTLYFLFLRYVCRVHQGHYRTKTTIEKDVN